MTKLTITNWTQPKSAKIGSSGDLAKIGSSGDLAKIGSSGDLAKIGSSGYFAKIGVAAGEFQTAGGFNKLPPGTIIEIEV